jgi:hypothetical protein
LSTMLTATRAPFGHSILGTLLPYPTRSLVGPSVPPVTNASRC